MACKSTSKSHPLLLPSYYSPTHPFMPSFFNKSWAGDGKVIARVAEFVLGRWLAVGYNKSGVCPLW